MAGAQRIQVVGQLTVEVPRTIGSRYPELGPSGKINVIHAFRTPPRMRFACYLRQDDRLCNRRDEEAQVRFRRMPAGADRFDGGSRPAGWAGGIGVALKPSNRPRTMFTLATLRRRF